MFDLQIENILKDFYEYEYFFSEEDFLYFGETSREKEILFYTFDKDPRFIKISNENLSKNHYLSKQTLFIWYCRTNLKLAKLKIFQIRESQLDYCLTSLCRCERFRYNSSNIISFGKKYGFIDDTDCCDYQYIFPIAYILSFMKGEKPYRVINTIIEKISFQQEIDNINYWNLSQEFVNKGLACLRGREGYIIKSREGLLTSKKLTLNEIGINENITRERVRQIERKAWKKLTHYSVSYLFATALLSHIIYMKGCLVFTDNTPESCFVIFLAKCSNINISKISKINKIILGDMADKIDINKIKITTHFEHIETLNWLKTNSNVCLNKKNSNELSESISIYCKKALTKEQKVYISLKKIGKPAHFSRISIEYNSLFPNSPSTEHNVHAVLTRKKYGIVNIGIRGTYALREWGYESPSFTLFETVTKIVKKKYKETKKPVHFNIILAEIGKYRSIVNKNSIVIASHCNPTLQRIEQNSFIPIEYSEQIRERVNFEDILDSVLKEIESNF